jgi:hypothetical protein
MKYKTVKLDGRWSYRKFFEYAIIFTGRMTNQQGPAHFSEAQKWFFDTYGWSAEIRQWADIRDYYHNVYNYIRPNAIDTMPECVNPYWSWTNGYDDLRIYVKSPQELTLFQLKYPVDQ